MNQEAEKMKPQKTWFFEDSEGRVFSTNEKEAFSLLTENSRWRRQDIKMIGCSDGSTYFEKIREDDTRIIELDEKLAKLKDKLDQYVRGQERLLFEQFLDEDDPKIQRANDKIQEVQDEIEPLEQEYDEIRKNKIQNAEKAELEVARGNMERPNDFTVIAKSSGDAVNGAEFLKNFTNAKRSL